MKETKIVINGVFVSITYKLPRFNTIHGFGD